MIWEIVGTPEDGDLIGHASSTVCCVVHRQAGGSKAMDREGRWALVVSALCRTSCSALNRASGPFLLGSSVRLSYYKQPGFFS